MKRARWWGVGALLVVLAACRPAAAAPAPVDRSGLAQVPATAPIVLYLHGAEGTKDRLLVTLKAALPEVLPLVQPQLDSWLKDGIEGRKLAGVPKDGPIFLVFTELPKPGENPPKMAVVLAVNKYEEFRDGLLKEDERKNIKSNGAGVERTVIDNSEGIYFVDKKGFAVVTPNEEVANAFAKKQAGLDGKMSKAQTAKFLAGDLGVYVRLDAVNKEYADQIKGAKEAIGALLDQAGSAVARSQKSGIEMAKKMIGPVFQAVEDSEGVLLTVDFRPGGFALHAQTELRGGSTTASRLEGLKLSGFKDLDRMPGGQIFYTGLQASGRMLEALGGALLGVANDPDSKDAKAVAESLEQMAKAGPGAMLSAGTLPASGIQVSHFEDPAKAVAAQLKMVQAAEPGSTLQGGALKAKPVVKTSAQKYGDFDFNSVEMTWDLDKMAEQAGGGRELPEETRKQIAEGMKALLGEKLTAWFGTDGKVVMQVTAKDWATAEKMLDRYFKGNKGAGDAPAFRDVRKELPAESSMVGLVDAVQYVAAVVDVVKPIFGGIFPLPPAFPGKPNKDSPSYVGAAVGLQPERGTLDVFISAGAVHEAYTVFAKPFLPRN
jgi:hypothetical protein